jgi:hypothetical protein
MSKPSNEEPSRETIDAAELAEAEARADPELHLLELGRQYGSTPSAILVDSAEGERAAVPGLAATDAGELTDAFFLKALRLGSDGSSPEDR